MKVIHLAGPVAWREWLLETGKELVASEQDVRLRTWHPESVCVGSVLRVSPDGLRLEVFPYDEGARPVTIEASNILHLEVFNSHRCSVSVGDVARMRNMRQVVFPPIPIDDSCP